MKDSIMITISRQYGSGGHEIGEKLAKKLGIPYYDQHICEEAKKNLHMTEYDLTENEESVKRSLLYSIANGMSITIGDKYKEDNVYRLFEEERRIIRQHASEGSCIIIGRCANCILDDYENCINIYIHAGMVKRIERIMDRYHVLPAQAREMIVKTDKRRAAFYNKFGRGSWGQREMYHMTLDSGVLGVEGTIPVIEAVVKNWPV